MNHSIPTPTDIQTHLYHSLLQGFTADVALHAKGAHWEAVYHLHRVVLIQAGFFRSLFTAGFLEADRQNVTGGLLGPAVDEVSVHLDDVNITRAAFEVCIARLYGGGPPLFLSPTLVPTATRPLTPLFNGNAIEPECPPDHHPATPRFLLSLLATSIYLSIPSIISHALSLIINSVGPFTVVRYLTFAMGCGIGSPDGTEPERAVGLEAVGREPRCFETSSCTTMGSSDTNSELDVTRKLCLFELGAEADKDGNSSPHEPTSAFNYGGIGDKIGEVCACWLTRWSVDILPYEEKVHSMPELPLPPGRIGRSTSPSRTVVCPKLWAKGGLTASWICALVSSNDFFIGDEWERYNVATRIYNLRGGVDVIENQHWENLFLHGICYYHMSFEELVFITKDISPVTGRPYIPAEAIHAAHWTQSLLRQRIFSRLSTSNASPASSPGLRDKELSITLSTADIRSVISDDPLSDVPLSDVPKTKPFYPVPEDSSQRIGDIDRAFGSGTTSAEELLGNSGGFNETGQPRSSQANGFGVLTPRFTAEKCIQSDITGRNRWSLFAPFRFGVEFWGVEQLPEKTRLYSRTIWYAGSLFNVYVQVVRKKGIQLGIYLQRQSSVDTPPRPSVPPVATRGEQILNSFIAPASSSLPEIQRERRPASFGGQQTVGSPAVASYVSFTLPGSPRPGFPSTPTLSTATYIPTQTRTTSPPLHASPVLPSQPYRDPRSLVSAYFTISSVSLTGSCMTRFSSSPDQFTIGQSWGWKSSSLQLEENAHGQQILNPESSLRAVIIMGLT